MNVPNFKELLDSFMSSPSNDQPLTDTITPPIPERLTEAFLTRIISTQAVGAALQKTHPEIYKDNPELVEHNSIYFRHHLIQELRRD